jgi:hypothetical protein
MYAAAFSIPDIAAGTTHSVGGFAPASGIAGRRSQRFLQLPAATPVSYTPTGEIRPVRAARPDCVGRFRHLAELARGMPDMHAGIKRRVDLLFPRPAIPRCRAGS